MNWARVALNTRLRHDFASFPPADHWAQVTVQLTSGDLLPGAGQQPGEYVLPYFLWLAGDDGIGYFSGCTPTPCPRWSARNTNVSAPVPVTPGVPFTVGYHLVGNTFNFYVNGVFVFSDTVSFIDSKNYTFLNYSAPFKCCQAVYYTDYRCGTSQGASDVFADDFSSGNLDNWYVESLTSGYPLIASVVSSPADDTCATLTASPAQLGPGEDFTLTGAGFTPGAPVQIYFTGGLSLGTPLEQTIVADGAGNIEATVTVPGGISNGSNGNFPVAYEMVGVDVAGRVGCGPITICTATPADGIQANWDNPTDQNPTNTPYPLVAVGGDASGSNPRAAVLDYIFHQGNHWILWADNSAIANAGVFNPIPTNHSLNATCISPDGSSVVDYPMDTPYRFSFASTNVGDPGFAFSDLCCGVPVARPVWDQDFYFSGWSKPIYDARFASDGQTLWVGVVTAQTIPFPYLDNLDARGLNPGSAAAFVPLGTLTAGMTSFWTGSGAAPAGYHRYISNTVGGLDIYKPNSYPITDAGEASSGFWSQPCVVVFAGGNGGFTQIGIVPAKYCPGSSEGPSLARGAGNLIGGVSVFHGSYRGSLYGRVAIAASEANPGVCHVVWSEGGDHGRSGEAGSCCSLGRWDGGPANRSYRVNYTTWSPSAKLTDQELWESHINRDNWYVDGVDWDGTIIRSGYTWPDQADFAALLAYDLRADNDNGDVLLFAGITQSMIDPMENLEGYPTPNYDQALLYCDTLHIWQINGGSPVHLQEITPDLFPNEFECDIAWPLQSGSNRSDATPTPRASDCMYAGPYPYNSNTFDYNIASFGVQHKGFGISKIYEDPTLGGQKVYLVHVPWARREPDGILTSGVGNWEMRAFYRIPADMSGPFEFLDGKRQFNFTVIGGLMNQLGNNGAQFFDSSDFMSDPNNIWIPSTGLGGTVGAGDLGYWFDRVCTNSWRIISQAQTPSDFTINDVELFWGACQGFHYDPASDSLAYVAPSRRLGTAVGKLFGIQQFYFCRGCRSCSCGVGVHLSHRF